VTISRGAGQGNARSPSRLPVRLPRRPPLQTQVRAQRQPADLRTEFRRLPVIPGWKAARRPHNYPLHRL